MSPRHISDPQFYKPNRVSNPSTSSDMKAGDAHTNNILKLKDLHNQIQSRMNLSLSKLKVLELDVWYWTRYLEQSVLRYFTRLMQSKAIWKSSIFLMGDCISSDDSSVETFKYPLESGSYLSNPGEKGEKHSKSTFILITSRTKE